MASRRVLVFDNDSRFLEFLKNSLGAYGFEVCEATTDLNDVQRLKAFDPKIIVIAVDLPDKAGFALYSRVKRAIGRNIPIVLVTATLPPQDMALHGKQTLHADIYQNYCDESFSPSPRPSRGPP